MLTSSPKITARRNCGAPPARLVSALTHPSTAAFVIASTGRRRACFRCAQCWRRPWNAPCASRYPAEKCTSATRATPCASTAGAGSILVAAPSAASCCPKATGVGQLRGRLLPSKRPASTAARRQGVVKWRRTCVPALRGTAPAWRRQQAVAGRGWRRSTLHTQWAVPLRSVGAWWSH